MAHAATRPGVSPRRGVLIAIDGVDGKALSDATRALAAVHRRPTASISRWGASGIFDELRQAESDAKQLSSRTLVLLYAADLAFRLRWEIQPALAAGRTVIAVPYILTAVAFGRASGLQAEWLSDLFHFAPTPSDHRAIERAPRRRAGDQEGFIEFAAHTLEGRAPRLSREQLLNDALKYVKAALRSED